MPELSQKQLSLLHHTLGVTPERRIPFRNHFMACPGHDDLPGLEALVEMGMMARARTPAFCDPADMVFIVTDAGEERALELLPPPPKRTKYQEYLRSEVCESFSEWLGIDVPRVEWRERRTEQGMKYEYRMYRLHPSWSSRANISGDWAPTRTAAKASYKAKLREHQAKMREWRKEWAA